jgi:hypothetical protein
MSKRRKIGDTVRIPGGVGFVLGKDGRKATIPDVEENRDPDPCFAPVSPCDDPECREWPTLYGEDGIMLCHINECEMSDPEE